MAFLILAALLVSSLMSVPAAQQTLNGSVIISSQDTYRIQPNFSGNASLGGFLSIKTNNNTIEALLQQAQNATFVSYDPEFTQILGGSPKADLILECSDAFAYEGATWDYVRNQIWFTSSIFSDKPTKLRRLNLTDNTVTLVETPLVNPNGAYYFDGWVYLTYYGNISTNPGIGRVNAQTHETEIVLNSYQGLPFNGPDDVTLAAGNREGSPLQETQLYFTDNSYGLTRPIPDLQLPNAVWRFTPSTGALVPVIPRADIIGPNGVRVNANGTKLYVGEYDAVLSGLDAGFQNIPGSSAIFEFDLDSRGFVTNKRLFGLARFGNPDGLHLDDYGRVWTGESEGVVVRNSNGKVIGIFNQRALKDPKVKTPIAQFSLAGDILVILAETRLWRVKLAQVVKRPGSFGN